MTKEEVTQEFGEGIEYVGTNQIWCSEEEFESGGTKKQITGRILATHGHQGDIFNMPFTPGPGCPPELAKKVVCFLFLFLFHLAFYALEFTYSFFPPGVPSCWLFHQQTCFGIEQPK